MPKEPLISVVMPAYNVKKYIAEAIQSVLSQTFTNWELLIVNDCSTDDTVSVIETFLHDPRIELFNHSVNKGLSAARNTAMQNAKGDFIALLDSDDAWFPEKLQKQLDVFQKHPEVAVCGTGMQVIDSDSKFLEHRVKKLFCGKAIPGLFMDLSIGASTSMFRRTVYEKIGDFDTNYRYAEDYDYWLRAARFFFFYIIPDELVYYRIVQNSLSRVYSDKRRDLVMHTIIPRFLNEYGGAKHVKWYHVWRLKSKTYRDRAMEMNNWFLRMYWLARAVACNPFDRDVLGTVARQFLPR